MGFLPWRMIGAGTHIIRVGERVGESDPDETSSMFSALFMLAHRTFSGSRIPNHALRLQASDRHTTCMPSCSIDCRDGV